MKVIDIFEQIEDLKELQMELKGVLTQYASDKEEYTIDRAVEAIDMYIRELMRKEVKE